MRISQQQSGPSGQGRVRDSLWLAAALAAVLLISGGSPAVAQVAQPEASGTSADGFSISDAELHSPLTFIVYGDMRFTDTAETDAAWPGPRQALVQKIAAEPGDVLFLTGDIPWHGGDPKDYQQFTLETAPWREQHLRVYPVLGNHEFSDCEEAACLQAWWQAFPQLAGRRWYALALGTRVRVLALDSNASLLPGSAQRIWLEGELQSLPTGVRFVMLLLHHPPVANQGFLIVRNNERSLSRYLGRLAHSSQARFIVVSGHVHNYERFERDGVVYVVSGGGGAKPLPVLRERDDKYRANLSPNFHFLRFTLQGDRLSAVMTRVEDPFAATPHIWAERDHFELVAKAPSPRP